VFCSHLHVCLPNIDIVQPSLVAFSPSTSSVSFSKNLSHTTFCYHTSSILTNPSVKRASPSFWFSTPILILNSWTHFQLTAQNSLGCPWPSWTANSCSRQKSPFHQNLLFLLTLCVWVALGSPSPQVQKGGTITISSSFFVLHGLEDKVFRSYGVTFVLSIPHPSHWPHDTFHSSSCPLGSVFQSLLSEYLSSHYILTLCFACSDVPDHFLIEAH
jgi:hypothetical protein